MDDDDDAIFNKILIMLFFKKLLDYKMQLEFLYYYDIANIWKNNTQISLITGHARWQF
jgi:hypothetical protein